MAQSPKIHPLLLQIFKNHLLYKASAIAVHIEDEGVYTDLRKKCTRIYYDNIHWESSNTFTRYQWGDILIDIRTDLFTLKKKRNNVNGEYLVSLFYVINGDYDQDTLMSEAVQFFPKTKIIRPDDLFYQILDLRSSEYRTLVELMESEPIPSVNFPVDIDKIPSINVSTGKWMDELSLESYYLKIDETYRSPQNVVYETYLIPTIDRIRNGIFADLLEKTNQSRQRGFRANGNGFYVLSFTTAGKFMVTVHSKTDDYAITYIAADSLEELDHLRIKSYYGLLPEIMKLVDFFVGLDIEDFKEDSKIGII